MERRYDEYPFALPGAVPWFPPNNGNEPHRINGVNFVHELPGNERADIIATTYQELLRAMKVPNDKKRLHERFIIQEDLDIIYADPARIPALISPDSSNVDMNVVRRDMRKIITVLVLIDARQCLGMFKNSLYRRHTPDLVDGDLPITQRSDLWFLPPQLQDRFIYEQYAVRPMKIREDLSAITLQFERHDRLPFQYIEEKIEVGGYGRIDRMTIPRGYLEDRSGRYVSTAESKIGTDIDRVSIRSSHVNASKWRTSSLGGLETSKCSKHVLQTIQPSYYILLLSRATTCSIYSFLSPLASISASSSAAVLTRITRKYTTSR